MSFSKTEAPGTLSVSSTPAHVSLGAWHWVLVLFYSALGVGVGLLLGVIVGLFSGLIPFSC